MMGLDDNVMKNKAKTEDCRIELKNLKRVKITNGCNLERLTKGD
jgi:hypothetical protein